ncbi:UPF0271 protein [Rhodovulum imhoffii]|uniref:5-oxoprolinase subunit A n=1 Tax=Rhodovulum imhoffii TaxID=365340 RepID=A0A2T5BTU4_9RHOB|nr:5-oxoprolinase subunit PxpA [Rhodovulum imhoffii]MBK5933943.1 hypothetical protein [Rhodovulum imhoffii]PTN02897.1 UPF0271 protein [Rhodovulum imhoffii]
MTQTVDLNADMGESYGAWTMGDDAALLNIVTSANVACGFHAGDWNVMAATMRAAVANGVGIGAHPGFPDLHGFGRQRMNMPLASLQNLVRYQIGAAQAMAMAAGGRIRHVKLHGALANMASEDQELATACYRAALSVAPDIVLMVLAGTAQQRAAQALGAPTACEIFADRAYNDDASLVDRSRPGAVIHDPGLAGQRVSRMVREGAIITESGNRVPTRIDTICLHGDTPAAVRIAAEVRRCLKADGVELALFGGEPV